MKFTHRLFKTKGWGETILAPSDCEEVKHLGKCPEEGDVFVAYDSTGHIHIFKGVLKEEKPLTILDIEERLKRLEDKVNGNNRKVD